MEEYDQDSYDNGYADAISNSPSNSQDGDDKESYLAGYQYGEDMLFFKRQYDSGKEKPKLSYEISYENGYDAASYGDEFSPEEEDDGKGYSDGYLGYSLDRADILVDQEKENWS